MLEARRPRDLDPCEHTANTTLEALQPRRPGCVWRSEWSFRITAVTQGGGVTMWWWIGAFVAWLIGLV
jgi:hypothetical protein